MIEKIISVALIVVAIIHALPISGYIGVDKLASLYDIKIGSANLEILMRHRAVLLGLLAVLFFYAAFNPAIQPIAFFVGFVSVLSFLHLAYSVGEFSVPIKKVVIADIVALLALMLASGLAILKEYK